MEEALINPMIAKYRIIIRDELNMTSVSFAIYNPEYTKQFLRELLKQYLEERDGV